MVQFGLGALVLAPVFVYSIREIVDLQLPHRRFPIVLVVVDALHAQITVLVEDALAVELGVALPPADRQPLIVVEDVAAEASEGALVLALVYELEMSIWIALFVALVKNYPADAVQIVLQVFVIAL